MATDDSAAIAAYALAIGFRIATHAASLSYSTIVFAGNSPYRSEDLRSLLLANTAAIAQDNYDSEDVDMMVVGTDCDLDVIEQVVDNSTAPVFLPQEGFIDRVLFGFDWWESSLAALLNSYLDRYPGLLRAKELADQQGFAWPSQEAPETSRPGVIDEAGFAPETRLRRECHYQITGHTRSSRWQILTECAIPRLGLREVVETIANHVRVRKAQRGGREKFEHAITEWEFDLSRLKREYYDGHNHGFRWPDIDP